MLFPATESRAEKCPTVAWRTNNQSAFAQKRYLCVSVSPILDADLAVGIADKELFIVCLSKPVSPVRATWFYTCPCNDDPIYCEFSLFLHLQVPP